MAKQSKVKKNNQSDGKQRKHARPRFPTVCRRPFSRSFFIFYFCCWFSQSVNVIVADGVIQRQFLFIVNRFCHSIWVRTQINGSELKINQKWANVANNGTPDSMNKIPIWNFYFSFLLSFYRWIAGNLIALCEIEFTRTIIHKWIRARRNAFRISLFVDAFSAFYDGKSVCSAFNRYTSDRCVRDLLSTHRQPNCVEQTNSNRLMCNSATATFSIGKWNKTCGCDCHQRIVDNKWMHKIESMREWFI